MRTILFVLVIVLSTGAFASFPLFDVVNFNGLYRDGAGNAKAEKFQVKDIDFGQNPEFSVEKQGSSLYLATPKGEYAFNDLPLISDNLEGLRWAGVSASSDGQKIKLAIAGLIAQVTNDIMRAQNFTIYCTNSGSKKEDALADSCFNNQGRIAFKKIENISGGKKTSIKDFVISMNKNRFSFRLTSSAKVKGSGSVVYKDNKVVFKFGKVKSGIFGVTKRFFKELKKIESENIKVSRPYITISM